MMNQDAGMTGSTVNSDVQASSDLHGNHLPDRSMEKCMDCRRRKKACRPIGRVWPDNGKCEECAKAGLECGPNTRYRSGTKTVAAQINDLESSTSTSGSTRPVLNSNAQWDQIKDSFRRLYIDEEKPLREVMKTMEREHHFKASKRQYHGQISKWGMRKYKTSAGSRMATPSNTSSPSLRHAEPTRRSISSSVEPKNFVQMRPPERPSTLSDAARHIFAPGFGGSGRSHLQNTLHRDRFMHENFVLVTPSDTRTPLQYSPLPNARDIRLVRLLPGHWNEPVSIELYLTDLDRAGDYEALSWVWGSEVDKEYIMVHNAPVQISKTLESALRHSRQEDMPRTLWIDAICINQEDLLEKSRQVQLMPDIYLDASTVLVWLGADTAGSSEAIRFVQTVVDIDNLGTLLDNPKSLYLWEAFADMLKLPWFRRAWTLQEVSLARDCILHWGSSVVSWSDFADAVDIVRSLQGSSQTSFLTSATLGQKGEFFHQLQISSVMQLVSASKCTSFRSGIYRVADFKPSLETLLYLYRPSHLSDPRDRVYAILSLTSEWRPDDLHRHTSTTAISAGTPYAGTPSSTDTGSERIDFTLFVVDYRKSVWRICFEVIELVLRHSDSVDIICRPWAPEYPGLELPTWISTVGRDSFKMAKNGLYTRVNADALVGAPGHVWKPYNACRKTQPRQGRFGQAFESGKLLVQGFTLCSVSNVASIAVEGCVPADWLTLAQWNLLDDLPPNAFWRTLVADRDDTGIQPPPTFFARACKWVFNQIVPGEHLNTKDILRMPMCQPSVAIFLRRLQSVIWKRRLFMTNQGYLGIGPEKMQVGDNVYILLGCSVPVVLRQIMGEISQYNLIGDCYVHGMMDGEACRGEPAFSEFCLR